MVYKATVAFDDKMKRLFTVVLYQGPLIIYVPIVSVLLNGEIYEKAL